MIPAIIKRFDAKRDELLAGFIAKPAESYKDIVKRVVDAVSTDDYGDEDYNECCLDPERITEIDHGDYQGTLLFIIAARGYQPSDFWYVKVGYGSCCGCDTLQAIQSDSDEPEARAKDYLTEALHIAQQIHAMNGDRA